MDSFVSKLIVGIDESSDIDKILSYGIRQFYFGFLPDEFYKLYSSESSLNRRYRRSEQFNNLQLAYKTIDKIKENNGTIYLALNGFSSNSIFLEFSQKVYESFKDKVDAVIVANFATALMLKELGCKRIVTSNLFGVYSKEAVAFLQRTINPYKIILPRDIELDSIKSIVTTYPEQKFEVFLYGDNCRFSESFCFSEHGYDSVGFGSLCSYAHSNKKLLKAPLINFKQIVKSGKLNDDEKRDALQKEYIDVDSLINKVTKIYFEGNQKELRETLEILERFDAQMFANSKELYQKSLFILEHINSNEAKKIVKKIKTITMDNNSYKNFHKLNSNAIQKSMEFFKKFENIVSYKIPSRGRGHFEYIFEQKDSEYNYKESQYKL